MATTLQPLILDPIQSNETALVIFNQVSTFRKILAVLLPIIIFSMNLIVLIVVPQVPSLKNSTGAAMISLAVCDAGVGFVTFVNNTNNMIMGNFYMEKSQFMCRVMAFAFPLFCVASLFTLSFVNFDRYLTLAYPFKYPMFMTIEKIVGITAKPMAKPTTIELR